MANRVSRLDVQPVTGQSSSSRLSQISASPVLLPSSNARLTQITLQVIVPANATPAPMRTGFPLLTAAGFTSILTGLGRLKANPAYPSSPAVSVPPSVTYLAQPAPAPGQPSAPAPAPAPASTPVPAVPPPEPTPAPSGGRPNKPPKSEKHPKPTKSPKEMLTR